LLPSSLLCIGQAFGWQPVSHDSILPSGLFFNSEVMSEFAALILVWAVLARYLPGIIIAAVPMAVADTRVGILAVVVGLFYAWRWKGAMTALFVAAVGAMAVVAITFLGVDKIGTAGLRVVLWGATAEAFRLFGNGLGWFQAAHPSEEFAHSDALQLAVELGIGALALALVPYAAFRGDGERRHKALFAAVCVEGIFSFPFHMPAEGFIGALVAGSLAALWRPVRGLEPVGGTRDGQDFQRQNATVVAVAGGSR
jgi:hypothetical protein